ncbi:5869_t:CDS:1, partial [Gigaspora margarita]
FDPFRPFRLLIHEYNKNASLEDLLFEYSEKKPDYELILSKVPEFKVLPEIDKKSAENIFSSKRLSFADSFPDIEISYSDFQ